jgi:hypothetical protein
LIVPESVSAAVSPARFTAPSIVPELSAWKEEPLASRLLIRTAELLNTAPWPES